MEMGGSQQAKASMEAAGQARVTFASTSAATTAGVQEGWRPRRSIDRERRRREEEELVAIMPIVLSIITEHAQGG
jgi:hypothetical protein